MLAQTSTDQTSSYFPRYSCEGLTATDVEVSLHFKPVSGTEDASAGIVFRFAEGCYYVVRANALGENVRLYYYGRSRHQLATATVQPPTLGRWHTLRVVVVGNHIQASLDGERLLDQSGRLDHRLR